LIPLALFFVLFLYRFLPLDLRFNVSGLQSRVISGTSGIMHWLKNFNKPGAEVDGKQNKFIGVWKILRLLSLITV